MPSSVQHISSGVLPHPARQAAYDSILNRGFPAEGILDNYRFSHAKNTTVTINALIFADPLLRDPAEYASFTLYHAINGKEDNELVELLAQTAAPFHLIHRDNHFSFWASTVNHNAAQPIPIERDIAYDRLDAVLSSYAVDLNPQKIIQVKQGREQFATPFLQPLRPLQLALWATDLTNTLLVEHFGAAINHLRQHQHGKSGETEKITIDLATQLLGATILADTGGLGYPIRQQGTELTLDQLIRAAHRSFPSYFTPSLFDAHSDAAHDAYTILRQISYSSFAPSLLIDLYTTAYDKLQRKTLGRFDTPLYLTRRIWENLPVELLPPEQRLVADMTCGWGSFLIAGYERLAHLKDMERHTLRNYLYGNDKDYLTARLAGLGLLLSTLTDSWHIDHKDAFHWTWLQTHQPGIIVGNPPFSGSRKAGQHNQPAPSSEGKRRQAADDFLKRAIERLAPGGYLAMLMPSSFVAAESAPFLRKALLETCDMQEIWDFPEGVFVGPTVRVVVLFAQKRRAPAQYTSFPVRTRTVQQRTLESLWEQHERVSLDSHTVTDNANWYICGEVQSVDAENQTVTLWMDGFDALQTVTITPDMPGWLLRPETPFCTKIPVICERQKNLQQVTWGPFKPQEFAYMDEETLLADLSELFLP